MLDPGDFVDGSCPTVGCEDYMIAKRYPTKIKYIYAAEVVMFVTLAPQCPRCTAFLPLE